MQKIIYRSSLIAFFTVAFTTVSSIASVSHMSISLMSSVPIVPSVQSNDITQEFLTADGSGCRLYGTLLNPAGDSAQVVVLIVAGSGPTDRNGNQVMMRNNSLKMLATELARHNIASLRYDKRGVGESRLSDASMSDPTTLVVEDYVEDVALWVRDLRRMRRYDKIVVVGHSEGALLGMVAINGVGGVGGVAGMVDGFVSIAGAGRPLDVIIKEQLEPQPPQVRDIAYEIVDSLKMGVKVERVPIFLSPLFANSVQPFIISLLKYSPRVQIGALRMPVLLIQGDHDLQIKVLDARILFGAARSAEVVVVPGMNHVLKNCDSFDAERQMGTYINPALPINETVARQIVRFINSRVL